MLIIIGVLIGAVLVLWWHDADQTADVLEQRAVGLQAGVLAGDTATVRWPSWTPGESTRLGASSTGATATVKWPSWTPVPSNTPRVYPSWTPEPTATSRRSATPTAPADRTATPTVTATLPLPPDMPTLVPPQPTKECEAPWPFTQNERLNIQAAALNHLWMDGRRDEPQTMPQEDALLSIGLYALDLGAPLTDEFRLLGDAGGRIRVRGFALGIVALAEWAADDTCRNWAVVSWGGEARD